MKKVVIVTGASRGIGRCIAEKLSQKGYMVIGSYNKSEKEAIELKESNNNIEIFKANVSIRKEVKELVDFVISRYGRIDVLINNAAISEYKLFTEETDEDWNRIINTNLYSVFAMSQEVSKQMLKQKEGLIINISSIWGQTGGALEVIYSASKAGVDGMTKALAKELGLSNIRVNSIAPGIIKTDMNSNFSEDEIAEIEKEIPVGKIGNSESISKAIEWLIEDDYTTGQVISINGGWYI